MKFNQASKNQFEFLNEEILQSIIDLTNCFDYFITGNEYLFNDFLKYLYPIYEITRELFDRFDFTNLTNHLNKKVYILLFEFYSNNFKYKSKCLKNGKLFHENCIINIRNIKI